MTATKLHSIAAGRGARGFTDHIAVRIVRISEALMRAATQTIEKRWGLKNTDLRLLTELDAAETLTVATLARRVHVDKAWVSRSLRDLETRGLVQRNGDPGDSRKTLVGLSVAGRELLEQVRPQTLRSELALLEGIDARALKAMLDRLEQNATATLERARQEESK